MIGLDANILIRLAVRDDKRQFEQAHAVLQKLVTAERPGYINLIVLAEFSWTLRRFYRISNSEVCEAVTKLLDSKNIEIGHRAAVIEALQLVANTGCDFTDALISAVNRVDGCEYTLTFDKKFANAGAARLVDS